MPELQLDNGSHEPVDLLEFWDDIASLIVDGRFDSALAERLTRIHAEEGFRNQLGYHCEQAARYLNARLQKQEASK